MRSSRASMFYLGDKTKSVDEGRKLAGSMIASGKAKEKFRQGIRLQGGDERVIDEPQRLPKARSRLDVASSASGFITSTDCEGFGIALAMLGGGREKKEDKIDHGVGLDFFNRTAAPVKKGELLATIHYNSDAKLAEAKGLISGSYHIGEHAPREKRPLVRHILGA